MLDMTIGGQEARAAATFDVVNPATGEVFAQAPECTPEQLDEAFESARSAQAGWAADEGGRTKAMLLLAERLAGAGPELAGLLTSETGKPLALAGFEPMICAMWLQYYAGMDMPRKLIQHDATAKIEVAHRPLGVVAAITPWNFPLGLAMWKISAAIRAGNTVVLKPSPYTPLATLRMGQLMAEVLPPGVVNVVTGGDALGAAMSSHPVPRKVSFTGSVSAGTKVAVAAAADLKRVTLELGGNDAAIVLADADVAAVAQKLFATAFFNTGQACALPKRIYAHESIHDELAEALGAMADAVELGDPTAAGAQMGPLSTRPQLERVQGLVGEALGNGVRAVSGGAAVDGPGFFFRPTVLVGASDSERIVTEEQFGPALPVLSFSDPEDALRRANDTSFGLSGSVWSRDEDRARALAERLECGYTWVNTHAALLPHTPFGGAKHSGVGVENGVAGLLSFTQAQTVHVERAGEQVITA